MPGDKGRLFLFPVFRGDLDWGARIDSLQQDCFQLLLRHLSPVLAITIVHYVVSFSVHSPELQAAVSGLDLQLGEMRGAEGGHDLAHESALCGRTAADVRRGRGLGRGGDTAEDDGDKHGEGTRSHGPKCTSVGP